MLTGAALLGRYNAGKNQSIRYFWSTVIVAIPLFAIGAKVKLEGGFSYGGHRRTLEEKLDYNPITRRAWYRALEENNKYQSGLKAEIDKLELMLIKKKLRQWIKLYHNKYKCMIFNFNHSGWHYHFSMYEDLLVYDDALYTLYLFFSRI